MAPRGNSRSRILLVILLVTALFLITLDLRGVSLISGTRSATQTFFHQFKVFLRGSSHQLEIFSVMSAI